MLFSVLLIFLPYIASSPIEIYENTPKLLNQTQYQTSQFIFQTSNDYMAQSFKDIMIKADAKGASDEEINAFISIMPLYENSSNFQRKCDGLLQKNPCVFSFENSSDFKTGLLVIHFNIRCLSKNCLSLIKVFRLDPLYLKNFQSQSLEIWTQGDLVISFPSPSPNERLILRFEDKTSNTKTKSLIFSQGDPTIFSMMSLNIVIFENQEKITCPKCNITGFLDVDVGSRLEVELLRYESNITDIVMGRDYFDAISTMNQNFYRINLPPSEDKNIINGQNITKDNNITNNINDNECFTFKLKSISGGEKSLHVNLDILPKIADNYSFCSDTGAFYYLENDIEFCQKDIKALEATGKVFYISVNSNLKGSLFIFSMERTYQLKRTIRLEVAENGMLTMQEFRYYELEIFDTDEEEGTMEVLLTKPVGDVHLYARLCDEPCDLITEDQINKGERLVYKGDRPGDEVFVFKPKCINGLISSNLSSNSTNNDTNNTKLNETANINQNKTINKCFILFALQGSKNQSNFYRFLIKRLNAFITLLENFRHESHISSQAKQTFNFYLFNLLKDVESIEILLTGDLDLELQFQSKEGVNETIYWNSHYPLVFNETHPFLSRDYQTLQIHVFSSKEQHYSILVRVERKNLLKTRQFVKILEGRPFRGVITKNSREVYLQYQNEHKGPSIILLNLQSSGSKNKAIAYIQSSGDTLPSETNFQWKSVNDFLEISQESSDKLFKTYTISIQHIGIEPLEEDLSFSILIETNFSMKIIESNTFYIETIQANAFKSMIFFINPEESKLTCLLSILNPMNVAKGLLLEIGKSPILDPNNNQSLFSLVVKKEEVDLILTRGQLNDICDYSHCKLFISVKNYESELISYSLNLYLESFALEINDGFENRIPLEATGDILNLFYRVKRTENFDLSVRTKGLTDVFISFFDNKEFGFKVQCDCFPNKDKYAITSKASKSHSVSIAKIKLEVCWPKCIVLLSIIPRIKVKLLNNNEKNENVWVIISGESSSLILGKPIIFSLISNQYKYFSYELTSLLSFKASACLHFALSHYFGDGGVYFKLNDDFFDKMPLPNDFDYFSYDGHISIPLKDLDHIRPLQAKAHPKLLIAVFCSSKDCHLSLNLQISSFQSFHIFSGIPQEVSITKSDNTRNSDENRVFYLYKNIASLGFKVKFLRSSGIGKMNAVFCPNSKDLAYNLSQCFVNQSLVRSIFFASPGESHILWNNSAPEFCEFCDLIVEIESFGDLKGSLLIIDLQDFSLLFEGKQLLDSLNQLEENKYRIFTAKARETKIKVSIFSGDPTLYINNDYESDVSLFENKLKKSKDGMIIFSIPPQPDDVSGDYDVHKPYFLVMKSEKPCNYSIVYTTGQILQSLTYGLLEKEQIIAEGTQSYIFQTKDSALTKYLTLVSDIGFEGLLISFLFKAEKSKEFSYISLNETLMTFTSYIFTIPRDLVGLFRVNLENIFKKTFFIGMILNSVDAIYLPFDMKLHAALTYKTWKYYEVYCPEDGYLLLDLMTCSGDLYLGYTMNYLGVFLHEWEGSFNLYLNNYVHVIKVTKGMYYFGVQSLEKGIQSFFELKVDFYESYFDIPQISVVPGGSFDMEYDDKGIMSFKYQNVRCEEFCEKDEMEATRLEYEIIIADSKKTLNSYGKCMMSGKNSLGESKPKRILSHEANNNKGIIFESNMYLNRNEEANDEFDIFYKSIKNMKSLESNRNLNHYPNSNEQIELKEEILQWRIKNISLFESNQHSDILEVFKLKQILKNEKLICLLKVKVIGFRKNKDFTIYYTDLEVNGEKKRTPAVIGSFSFFIGCLGFLLTLSCFCCGLHYWKNYLKNDKTMTYEMQDVRNAVQIRGVNETITVNEDSGIGIDNVTKSYIGLVEE